VNIVSYVGIEPTVVITPQAIIGKPAVVYILYKYGNHESKEIT
jgi:hypothetical protein